MINSRWRRWLSRAACVLAASGSAAQGATLYTFDGTTDQTWEGQNWNNGTPGQSALESTGGDAGLPPTGGSYDYLDDSFVIDNGSAVTSGDRVTLRNGSLTLSGGAEFTVTAGGARSAFNLGFGGGSGASVVFNNATATLTGSGTSGRAVRLENGSSWGIVDSTVTIASSGNNDSIEVENGNSMFVSGSTLDMGYLRLDSTSTSFDFDSGAINLSRANGFRGTNPFSGQLSFTGAAGVGVVTHLDSSDGSGRTLAQRVFAGFFAIDGIAIDPEIDGFNAAFDGTIAADIAALNAELASTYVIGGRYFEIGFDAGDVTGNAMTLSLVAVPEPSSLGLLVASFAVIAYRRRIH